VAAAGYADSRLDVDTGRGDAAGPAAVFAARVTGLYDV
jgi:hypothetical protein